MQKVKNIQVKFKFKEQLPLLSVCKGVERAQIAIL